MHNMEFSRQNAMHKINAAIELKITQKLSFTSHDTQANWPAETLSRVYLCLNPETGH